MVTRRLVREFNIESPGTSHKFAAFHAPQFIGIFRSFKMMLPLKVFHLFRITHPLGGINLGTKQLIEVG